MALRICCNVIHRIVTHSSQNTWTRRCRYLCSINHFNRNRKQVLLFSSQPYFKVYDSSLNEKNCRLNSTTHVLNKNNVFSTLNIQHRRCITTVHNDPDLGDEIDRELEEMDKWLKDPEYHQAFSQNYLLPSSGHNVFLLQPDYRQGDKRFSSTTTTAQNQLMESVALIDTLPMWSVARRVVYPVKTANKIRIWGKGNFREISERIGQTPGVTAVVVNVDMLTGVQLAELQKQWRLPVYDRYTLVLQIFKTHARTKVAKLQVALAEIPYLRSRLRGTYTGDLGQQSGGFAIHGGQSFDDKKELLQQRELKLKKAITKVESQRALEKKERKRREIPTVAIVGYTNSGKTSLIKALTGDIKMKPRNQLFATLDVTVHEGRLHRVMPVLYVDTVGFISNIPTDLIASFSATLSDMLDADAIVVVNDISQSDFEWQQKTVIKTLESLSLPPRLAHSIIHIYNKIDLVDSSSQSLIDRLQSSVENPVCVSATKGVGLSILEDKVKKAILKSTDREQKRFKIPLNGDHRSWLYKEATIVREAPVEGDTEAVILDTIITKKAYSQFKKLFGKPAPRKKQSLSPR